MWHHAGPQGTIYFPAEWLDATTRCFYGLRVHTSGPMFEFAIMTNVHLLSPEWRLREKDRQAIEYFRSLLQES